MSLWSDVYTPAMRVEEAALLPARSRSIAGRSALQDAMRRADAMKEMQLSNTVQAGSGIQQSAQNEMRNGYAFPGSRAALHQVLRRT